MEYRDFIRLCEDQWAQVHRGDVVGLQLKNESMDELSREALRAAPDYVSWGFDHENKDSDSARLLQLTNPVTRSVVYCRNNAEHDTAIVSHGQLGEPDRIPL